MKADRKFTRQAVDKRAGKMEQLATTSLEYLRSSTIDPEFTRHNIENLLGFAQVPVGIIGPLKVKADHADGDFYIPLATTEGALVMSYHRGAKLIHHSGGAICAVTRDAIQRASLFELKDLTDTRTFLDWSSTHLEKMKRIVDSTTCHGKLLGFSSFVIGNTVILRFEFYTKDAMGMNMVSKATKEICDFIQQQYPIRQYILECNMAVDKKPSFMNLINGRGKTVVVESLIQRELVKKFLKVTPERIVELYNLQINSNIYAGVIGANYQAANGLAAIFLACGQDIANIADSSLAITKFSMQEGDLYASMTIPSLIVGTIGGGTSLPTQSECLKIMGCYGNGKALKFAEIIGAVLLAGEISLAGSIAANDFVEAHEKYGRNGHKTFNENI